MKNLIPPPPHDPPLKASRRILIVGGPKVDLGQGLSPHDIIRTANPEESFESVSKRPPDLIVLFIQKKDEPIEEYIISWLLHGFRGRLAVFDPHNALTDARSLLHGHIIDSYVPGPLSPDRFMTIVRSDLSHVARGGTSRTLALFDLFLHLFERGLDAIFFFSEDLTHCVAANLQAERMSGRTLFELRRTSLKALCGLKTFEDVGKSVRRARHSYYDVHGKAQLLDRFGRVFESDYGTGVFRFGRTSLVKFEIHNTGPAQTENPPLPAQSSGHRVALRRRETDWRGENTGISLVVCRVLPTDSTDHEDEVLEDFGRRIQATIRKTDRLARLGRRKFGLILPSAGRRAVEAAAKRIQGVLLDQAPKGCRLHFEMAHCPPEAQPFLQLLQVPSPDRAARKRRAIA